MKPSVILYKALPDDLLQRLQVHRGMEKLAETRMGYNEVTFLSDRVCGICGFAHSTAYTTSFISHYRPGHAQMRAAWLKR